MTTPPSLVPRCSVRAIAFVGLFALATALPAAAGSPRLDVDGMTFVASRGGVNELVLRADRAKFHTEEERVELETVHAIVEPSDVSGSFDIRCETGELDLATNDFEAHGNVRGETDGGRRFTAPWVKYDHEAGLLFTSAPVLITEDAISYRGGGFQYYIRDRRFRLLGGASVVQAPPEDVAPSRAEPNTAESP